MSPARAELERGAPSDCETSAAMNRRVTPSLVAAVTAGYLVAGKLGLLFAFEQANATPVWPPAGIALAAFLLLGLRVWPAILLGAFLVNVTTAGTAATSLGIAVGNTLEGVIGALLVWRYAAGVRFAERPRDVLRFAALAGVIGPAVSATCGVTSLSLGGFSDWASFGSVWSTWWLGDVTGILLVTPLVTSWATSPRVRFGRAQSVEALLLALALVSSGAAVFGELLPEGARSYALDVMVVPPLVWAAFRFGQRETATAAFVLSGIALWGTLAGLGPFVRATPSHSLLVLQIFLGGTSALALLFAALVAESREAAAARVLEERLRFETLLSDLMAGLIQVPASEIDAALEAGVRAVAAFLAADRASLEEYLGGGRRISWAAPGLEEPPRVTQADRFPWAAERLRNGQVVRFASIRELPAEAALDRAGYRRCGTRSKVSVPLVAGARVLGALSFGSVRRERAWPDELVSRLQLLSKAFASALERKRMDVSLAERLRFERLLSNLTAAFRDSSNIDFEREIERGLRRVADFLRGEHAGLLEFAREPGPVRSWGVEEWLNLDESQSLLERLQRGESVRGAGPSLAVPLVVDGTAVGGLVLGAIGAPASSEELGQQIDLIAEVFANALSRRQADLEAQRLRQDLAHIGRVSTVGELTASLAHDLSQPLGAILNNAQAAQRLLAVESVSRDEIAQILGDIVADDKRAGDVIRRLRALLKKGGLERAPLDLNEVVSEVARLVRSDAVTRHVALRLELAERRLRVRGDRVQLQQVVLNLVLNGMQAMRESPTWSRQLVIRTGRDGDSLVAVEVEDWGTGIAGEDLEKIFLPLYTTKDDGLGMGLAIARTIVDAHAGRLQADNNGHGGATFRFTLPAAGSDS